jgi:hypothetical protein
MIDNPTHKKTQNESIPWVTINIKTHKGKMKRRSSVWLEIGTKM